MKVGDLVKIKDDHLASHLGIGILMSFFPGEDYAVILFHQNEKWIQLKDLEVINDESRRFGKK